ncbi:MAG: MFS transporter, partial [Candidatus Acidiferrales bacterium]
TDDEFPRAVAATSSAFQICTMIGPALGGLIYAVSGPAMFALTAALHFFASLLTRGLMIANQSPGEPQPALVEKNVLAGIRYIRSNRLLLSLLSLDLFAVLLGGVTALLPIYARDILAAGPFGLGCLRCAPGIGAALIGLFLAHRTVNGRSGRLMLSCVAGFGLATAVFAISRSFVLSLFALAVAGGFDMVSMVIRQTMVHLLYSRRHAWSRQRRELGVHRRIQRIGRIRVRRHRRTVRHRARRAVGRPGHASHRRAVVPDLPRIAQRRHTCPYRNKPGGSDIVSAPRTASLRTCATVCYVSWSSHWPGEQI